MLLNVDLEINDFNVFLHQLRTIELQNIPKGAKIFLSGGCSGNWYFDWINQNYPGIEKHIGVEYYSSQPSNLPPEVKWIKNNLNDMNNVDDSKVELIFAGQTIEHLWANELSSFLIESHRVLKNNGLLVLDSPNRRITTALRWFQPQHTLELTVEEIIELLELAGFDNIKTKGIWLCYDRETHRFLPLLPTKSSILSYQERIRLSNERPEDCFIWWVEAKKSKQKPNPNKLLLRLTEIYSEFLPARLSRQYHNVGELFVDGSDRYIKVKKCEKGALLYGPYVPLNKGNYMIEFLIKPNIEQNNDDIIFTIDVYDSQDKKIIVQKVVKSSDVLNLKFNKILLPFTLDKVNFGLEFRIFTTGVCELTARHGVSLRS